MAAPDVPHPDDRFVLGSSLGFQRDILGTFVDGWREQGDVCWFRTPRPMYVLAHPDHVKHILHDHHEHHPRSGYVRKMLKNVMGEGLFTCDERLWRHQVGLIAPPFAPERVAPWASVMTSEAGAMLDRWKAPAAAGETLDVQPELVRLSLDVIGRILFGDEDWSRHGLAVRDALVTSCEWAIPRVTGFPTPIERLTSGYRRFLRAREALDAIIDEAVADRRRRGRGDLISTYVEARDAESGSSLDDRGVHDAVTGALFGTYKGPPLCMTWALYLLAQHPGPRQRLETEVDSVLGSAVPTVADLDRLPYTGMFVHETLRLYPPLWLMSRPPDAEEEIGGYRVPERVFLISVPYITHRHEEFWTDPESFDPERFTPERGADRHPYSYLPFGKAHRKCIGEAHSLMQVRLTLAMIVQRFRLEVASEDGVGGGVTEFLLRPAEMPMRLSPRGG